VKSQRLLLSDVVRKRRGVPLAELCKLIELQAKKVNMFLASKADRQLTTCWCNHDIAVRLPFVLSRGTSPQPHKRSNDGYIHTVNFVSTRSADVKTVIFYSQRIDQIYRELLLPSRDLRTPCVGQQYSATNLATPASSP